jgi:hypothetical protein
MAATIRSKRGSRIWGFGWEFAGSAPSSFLFSSALQLLGGVVVGFSDINFGWFLLVSGPFESDTDSNSETEPRAISAGSARRLLQIYSDTDLNGQLSSHTENNTDDRRSDQRNRLHQTIKHMFITEVIKEVCVNLSRDTSIQGSVHLKGCKKEYK